MTKSNNAAEMAGEDEDEDEDGDVILKTIQIGMTKVIISLEMVAEDGNVVHVVGVEAVVAAGPNPSRSSESDRKRGLLVAQIHEKRSPQHRHQLSGGEQFVNNPLVGSV